MTEVSVVIPALNKEETIAICINRVKKVSEDLFSNKYVG